MATVELLLWPHYQKKNGTRAIVIRIIKDRKPRYAFTGKYVLEKDWDSGECRVRKSHEDWKRLNAFLRKKLSEVEGIADKAEISDENLSSAQIKKRYKRQSAKVSFFQLAAERIKNKHLEGTYSVSQPELSYLFNLEEFINLNTALPKAQVIEGIKDRRKQRISEGRAKKVTFEDRIKYFEKKTSLYFQEIDLAFLNRFKSFCSGYLDHDTRSITNQMMFIRTMFNLAINDKLVDPKYYPFGADKEKITLPDGNKVGLNAEEVPVLEGLELEPKSSLWETRNAWLLAFYFAGERVSDLVCLKWSDFLDGRYYYEMGKTEAPVSIKISKEALEILNLYIEDKKAYDDYVFPFMKKADLKDPRDIFRKIRNATSLINQNLKTLAAMCGIEKKLSSHIARHTFGNIAGSNVHPRTLQKLYKHKDLKTTLIYQSHFQHEEIDEALETVISIPRKDKVSGKIESQAPNSSIEVVAQ